MATPSPLSLLLERRLSVERIGPYRTTVGGDLDRALLLYEWNATVGAAIHEAIGHLEVVLRNALHEQLTAWHTAQQLPGQWYDDPNQALDRHRRDDIDAARARIRRDGKVETSGKVVAELMFGFWRFLLDKRYQPTLWAQALRHAFPHLQPQRRVEVYDPVYALVRLRNRIAHHEPVHHLPLHARHDDLLRVAAYLDPAIEAWISQTSRVPALLSARP